MKDLGARIAVFAREVRSSVHAYPDETLRVRHRAEYVGRGGVSTAPKMAVALDAGAGSSTMNGIEEYA